MSTGTNEHASSHNVSGGIKSCEETPASQRPPPARQSVLSASTNLRDADVTGEFTCPAEKVASIHRTSERKVIWLFCRRPLVPQHEERTSNRTTSPHQTTEDDATIVGCRRQIDQGNINKAFEWTQQSSHLLPTSRPEKTNRNHAVLRRRHVTLHCGRTLGTWNYRNWGCFQKAAASALFKLRSQLVIWGRARQERSGEETEAR